MGNDKVFNFYAAILVSTVLTLLTAIVVSGVAAVPAPLFVAEHLGLGLLFRASYKSLAGPGWITWPSLGQPTRVSALPDALGAES